MKTSPKVGNRWWGMLLGVVGWRRRSPEVAPGRRRSWGTLVAVVGWLWSAVAWAGPEKVNIALSTRPEGSRFVLRSAGGEVLLRGKTPFVGGLVPGRYRLEIRRPHYYPEMRTLGVSPGKPLVLRITLLARESKRPPKRDPQARPTKGGGGMSPTTTAAQRRGQREESPPARGRRLSPASRGVARPLSAQRSRQVAPGQRPPPSQKTLAQQRSRLSSPTSKKAKNGSSHLSSADPRKKTKKPTSQPAKKIPWIPLAAGVAFGIAGGVFLGLAQHNHNLSLDHSRYQVEAYSSYLEAERHRSTSWFLLAGAGASLLVAGIIYFFDYKTKAPHRPQSGALFNFSPPPASRQMLE